MPILPLWSFIKEIFFNRDAAAQFAKRNQLSVLLLLSNFIMFGLLMFSIEQATNQHAAMVAANAKVVKLKEDIALRDAAARSSQQLVHDLANCENQLTFLAADYRAQELALNFCTTIHPKGKK